MEIKFDEMGLVPAIVQDARTREVRMLGYMSRESIEATLLTDKVTFWSRRHKRLWVKGESSGNFLLLCGPIQVDCDGDTLLVKAIPQGPTCHTGAETCFQNIDGTPRLYKEGREMRIVLPDGSMRNVVEQLFDRAGLTILVADQRTKRGKIDDAAIDSVMFQRPQEIPRYLETGHYDLAVVGEDWISNWQADVEILLQLPVSRQTVNPVRVVLAVANDSGYRGLNDLPQGAEIATEYVELTERYLRQHDRNDLKVLRSYGGTEHKIMYGAAAVVDITETGSSLRANELVIVEEIMVSNTVVAVNHTSYANPQLRPHIDWLVCVLKGAFDADKYVIIVANVPADRIDEASAIIGGLKSPTVSALKDGGYALNACVAKVRQHDIIFRLLQLGVTDIIVHSELNLVMGLGP